MHACSWVQCLAALFPAAGAALVARRPPPCLLLSPVLPQALEYQLQQGIADTAKVDACLVPAGARHDYAPEAHCAVGVIRRLQQL